MRIANQTVLPATQLAETNVVVDVETLVIRCQAAQRSRRSRELTDQAEAEYQRRSAGQRMRRRRELQEADALRIGARTSQVFIFQNLNKLVSLLSTQEVRYAGDVLPENIYGTND
ncbi:hypothetical protein MKX01_014127 [Papaver californicum]|nr:hypothetical protein MKX01_014127 [Papaver californicum]